MNKIERKPTEKYNNLKSRNTEYDPIIDTKDRLGVVFMEMMRRRVYIGHVRSERTDLNVPDSQQQCEHCKAILCVDPYGNVNEIISP